MLVVYLFALFFKFLFKFNLGHIQRSLGFWSRLQGFVTHIRHPGLIRTSAALNPHRPPRPPPLRGPPATLGSSSVVKSLVWFVSLSLSYARSRMLVCVVS